MACVQSFVDSAIGGAHSAEEHRQPGAGKRQYRDDEAPLHAPRRLTGHATLNRRARGAFRLEFHSRAQPDGPRPPDNDLGLRTNAADDET